MMYGFPHTYVPKFIEGQEGDRYTAVRYSDNGNRGRHHTNVVPALRIRRGGEEASIYSRRGTGKIPRAGYTSSVGHSGVR